MDPKIGERAIQLYNDRSQGYQRAIWIYQTIDTADKALGAAAMADKVGTKVNLLSFLSWLTPKADQTQLIDFSVKVVGESVAFCYTNGLPGDSVVDFARSLADYSNESIMRMAALICFDGMIPLGTEFLDTVLSSLEKLDASQLEENQTFQHIRDLIPGESTSEQLGFMQHSMASVHGWMKSFINSHNLNREQVTASLRNFIEISDDKLDYLGAFLDMATNYFEHTGIQTVARRLVQRAVSEI